MLIMIQCNNGSSKTIMMSSMIATDCSTNTATIVNPWPNQSIIDQLFSSFVTKYTIEFRALKFKLVNIEFDIRE